MTTGDTGYQVDTAIVYRYNGSAWKAWDSDWITYTPTLANITLGTAGTSTFKYRYVQGSIQILGYIKLGTSGMAMGSAPTFTLPVNAATLIHPNQGLAGTVKLYDDSATVPFTWAANDAVDINVTFEPA